MLRKIYRTLRSRYLHSLIPESQRQFPPKSQLNIEVVGFHSLSVGIGVSARLCAEDLSAAAFNVNCRDVGKVFRKKPEFEWSWENKISDDSVNCRIFHLNPPQLPLAIFSIGLKNFRSTYNIGYWAWEADLLSPEWQRAIKYINAIFAPSQFNQDVFKKYTDKPVARVPHPVAVENVEKNVRGKLGFTSNDFVVSFVFNFGSSFNRKNPLAVIDAFNRAFENTDNAYLVLKSNHGRQYADEWARLQAATKGSPKIRLFDEIWPLPRVMGLMADSNAFISLHRCEGFGLPIAEAISLEVPMVATNWSGNVDFCDPDNTYLVSASETTVDTSLRSFKLLKNAHWAEPDVDQAAKFLKTIFDEPGVAKERAKRAKIFMERYLAEYTYSNAIDHVGSAVGDT